MTTPGAGKGKPKTKAAKAACAASTSDSNAPAVFVLTLDKTVKVLSEVGIVPPASGVIERVATFKIDKLSVVIISTVAEGLCDTKVLVLGEDGNIADKIGFAHDEHHEAQSEQEDDSEFEEPEVRKREASVRQVGFRREP